MITALRRGATGWIAKILFILLIISFGAWGIVDYLQPDPDPVVIRVGDTEVRQSWVQSQFNVALQRLRERLGTTVTQELALDMGVDEQVVDSVIDQQVLTREAEALGLATNDSMLRSAIAQEPAFQGVTGQFDRGRYQQVLFQSGLTEAQFLADLQGRLLRDPLIAAAVAGPPLPQPLVDAQYAYFAQQRTISLLHKPHADLPTPADPGEGVLRAFYEGEDQAYNLPQLRNISAIVLSPQAIAKGFSVAEERIVEAYENRIDQYRRPEERTVAQLVFQDGEAAAKAAARLRQGESWVSVAGEPGSTAAELGSLTKAAMVPAELAGPAFALTEPGYTDPVQTPFGHHVLWVKAIDPSQTTPLADVREDLRHAIALDLAVNELIERANQVEDTVAAGGTLEDAAAAADVPVVTFSGISRTGQTADGSRPENLPQGGQFLGVAFQTEEGETSILTETPEGGYFVLRVDRVIASAKRPFEDVRERVLADWTESQRAEQAQAAADKLAEAVRAGTDFAEAGAAAGFAEAKPGPFARSDVPPPTTPDLVEAVFAAGKGQVIVVNDADRVFVARIDDVTVPNPAGPNPAGPNSDGPNSDGPNPDGDSQRAEQTLDRLRQILNRDRRQEVARAFQQAVRAGYRVEIDRPGIDRALR